MLSIKEALAEDFLQPEIDPTDVDAPMGDVVAWRNIENQHTSVEVYKTSTGLYTFRYRMWVAWRNADGEAEAHGWHTIAPTMTTIIDNLVDTCLEADRDIETMGLVYVGEWKKL